MKGRRTADARWMRRALELAGRGKGAVGTNALVGAVVVRGGRVVGEGWHARYGAPHAEPVALAAAGDRARGATLYVTLEPCGHTGKTPPCSRAIVASGVKTVFVALRDPSRGGRGTGELRRAGIRVVEGLLEDEARKLNESFLAAGRTRRPFVTLKLAVTLDGRIADEKGRSRWISSRPARAITRRLRADNDAVMVGAGTAAADDPGLRSPVAGRTPLRIIVDGLARCRPGLGLLRDGGPALFIVSRRAPAARVAALRRAGAEILAVQPGAGGVDLRRALKALYAYGVGTVLCEGGAGLAGSLIDGRLADRAVFVVAPLVIGGSGARSAVAGRGRLLDRALRLKGVSITRAGDDTLVAGRLC